MKMENSLLTIFDEIWPKTLYYIVQGLWPNFGATLKIQKKSNFDRNQLKLTTQHKYITTYKVLTSYITYNYLQNFGTTH